MTELPASENLIVSGDGAVTVLTVNRPKVLNALNSQTLDDLRRVLLAVQRDPDVRAIAQVLEATLFGLVASTDDMREGTAAFLQKRKAEFKGK